MIVARYDVILNQSERAHLYNTKAIILNNNCSLEQSKNGPPSYRALYLLAPLTPFGFNLSAAPEVEGVAGSDFVKATTLSAAVNTRGYNTIGVLATT